jgi:plasmid stability protein
MKTTLNIDDDLYRRLKAKAAMEGRRVTELVEEGVRTVLHQGQPTSHTPNRVKLPLIPAKAGQKKMFEGMTSEEIHRRLTDLEAQAELEGYEASL